MRYILFLLLVIALAIACGDEDTGGQQESDRITPNIGIGDVRFGEPGSAAVAAYGTQERITSLSGPHGTEFVIWFANGLAFRLDKVDIGNLPLQEIVDRSEELIDLSRPIIQMIIMSPYKGKTPEGIGLGSNKDEVITAYGEPDGFISDAENYSTLNMTFSYSNVDNTVRRMDMDD